MYKQPHKSHRYIFAIFALASLIIIIDFVSPGEIFTDEIIRLEKDRQQYYNAARNYHYSNKVVTSQHIFLVSEDVAARELVNKKIEYSVSPIFKKVNWHRLLSTDDKSFYSLRLASGIILPLLLLISMFMVFRYQKKMGTIVFILQILLIADLIFLIT